MMAGRPPGLTPGQVERHDAPVTKTNRTFRNLHRAGGIVVTERAVDDPRHAAEVALSSLESPQLGVHDFVQRHAAPLTQMRAVANLQVTYIVPCRVLDHL